MIADIDLQVWFDMHRYSTSNEVVPYVQSERDVRLRYDVKVLQSGKAGTSRISQGGTLNVPAGTPTTVSSVRVTTHPEDQCKLELTLSQDGKQVGDYVFDCAMKK